MSKKLPAQVRVHIRDLIDNADSEVQQSLKSLNASIGSGFVLEIAWDDIFRDLKDSFSDDVDKLVPSVGRHIIIFCNRLESILEQDEKFQETFLDEYPSLRSILSVATQVGLKTSSKIVQRKLTLLLPTAGEEGFRRAQASIGTDIPNLFNEEGDETTPTGQSNVPDEADEDQDWDTVNISSVKAETSGSSSKQDTRVPIKFQDAASQKPRPLPKFKSLQRPEVLFSDNIPAYLTIKGDTQEVWIEGSHAPTISLIYDYFKNFAARNMMDANHSPRFKVEQISSHFGSGSMTDCVHIELANLHMHFRINSSLFLSFAEGVCGYELVDCKNDSYTLKRTVPF